MYAGAPGNDAAFDEARQLQQTLDYDYLRQDIADLLRESKDGIDRVRKIVKDLMGFSRASDSVWELADIHQGIDSTLNMVWNELKYHCTVTKNYGLLPKISCLSSQINQVFMNLLVNAGHAIEDKGEITITTERVGDTAVCIKVRDTGKGIAPDALPRVFEPFYTTKPVGKGTGLGLSLAWNIVERHRGRIEVASEEGQGTTFTVTLPIEAKPAGEGESRA
jgi:signal transduction histidine kinase